MNTDHTDRSINRKGVVMVDHRRSSAAALLGVGLAALALSACTPGASAPGNADAPGGAISAQVPATALATEIGKQLQQQKITVDAGSLTCPQPLSAAAGQSATCTFTSSAQPVKAVAKVTKVAGTAVDFEISAQAQPVPKSLLAQQVRKSLEGLRSAAGAAIGSVECAGELPAEVGQKVSCQATSGGKKFTVVVTAFKITSGQVSLVVDSS